jgi:preprotein translocase subunit SecB
MTEKKTPDASNVPFMKVNMQYVKDLSFENPNSPKSLLQIKDNPEINFQVDLNAQKLNEDNYEVSLNLTAKAHSKDDKEFIIFITELVYAGLFTLKNIPQEKIEEVLLIQCPHILFPFARRIIADTTRDGGFPPLMMEPIDFASLYMNKLESKKSSGGNDAVEKNVAAPTKNKTTKH